MSYMHSAPKEQREAVRQLVHLVITRDMSTFNPERFRTWFKDTDQKFRRVGLTLKFEIRDRVVLFSVKEMRSGRTLHRFDSSTRVPFDDRDVIMSADELVMPMKP